jgi:hypothetical protein
MALEPRSLAELISEVRSDLVCSRCGKYVGSLGGTKYVPPPYPVALQDLTAEDEAAVLIGFESHMVGLLRQGNFRISHPQVDGRCSSFREWVRSGADLGEGEADEL